MQDFFASVSFAQRSALIMGGGSGLGRAIAIAVAAAGATVSIADVDEVAAQETLRMLPPARSRIAVKVDIGNVAEIDACFAELSSHGPLDILVNCAAICLV